MKIYVDQLPTCRSCGFKGIIGISFAADCGWNVDTGCTLIKGEAEIDGRREDCPLAVLPTVAKTDKTNEPPLGLKPKWLHEEQRIDEILDAMSRHSRAHQPIPEEWAQEMREIVSGYDYSKRREAQGE